MNTIKPLAGYVCSKLLIVISLFLFTCIWNITSFAKTIKVIDCLGRKIEISLPIKRIVVLNSDALEVVRLLNAEDLVVGVYSKITKEPEFWGNLVNLPKVGNWNSANFEKIAILNPDLVIAYGTNPGPELDTKLKTLHISLLRLNFYKINTFKKELITISNILDKKREAKKFLEWYEKKLKFVKNKLLNTKNRPKVYVESYNDYIASGPGSGADEMCSIAGGYNIGREFNIPYPHVSPEWIVSQDPEIIIKPASWGKGYSRKSKDFFNKIKNNIINRPGFFLTKAVKNNRVYVIDSSIWCGPEAIIGIGYLVKWFYPTLFQKFDPSLWHKEYLERFQKIPYKGYYVSN
ncbi:iron ABC transporter substrate-binding protein [Desulfothermus okinawensis JCM 13304]